MREYHCRFNELKDNRGTSSAHCAPYSVVAAPQIRKLLRLIRRCGLACVARVSGPDVRFVLHVRIAGKRPPPAAN